MGRPQLAIEQSLAGDRRVLGPGPRGTGGLGGAFAVIQGRIGSGLDWGVAEGEGRGWSTFMGIDEVPAFGNREEGGILGGNKEPCDRAPDLWASDQVTALLPLSRDALLFMGLRPCEVEDVTPPMLQETVPHACLCARGKRQSPCGGSHSGAKLVTTLPPRHVSSRGGYGVGPGSDGVRPEGS